MYIRQQSVQFRQLFPWLCQFSINVNYILKKKRTIILHLNGKVIFVGSERNILIEYSGHFIMHWRPTFFSYQVSNGDFMICPKIRAALYINFFIEQVL